MLASKEKKIEFYAQRKTGSERQRANKEKMKAYTYS
jgi:hypothetical protein